jgi:hypothetical protein
MRPIPTPVSHTILVCGTLAAVAGFGWCMYSMPFPVDLIIAFGGGYIYGRVHRHHTP